MFGSLMTLLLGGVLLRPVLLDEPVLDVRVADLDQDGKEDVIAVTKRHLLLFRGGLKSKKPDVVRDAPALAVVGNGLLGVVRDGRYRTVSDPFGKWTEGEPGPASLLGALGTGAPALIDSPGDLDGDGKDDCVLAGPEGVHANKAIFPVTPKAELEIKDNETFGVRYQIPVPVIGSWTGKGRQAVFVLDDAIVAYSAAGEVVARVPLPPPPRGEDPSAIRRRHILLRDVDGDSRLDMVVVQAKGSMRVFSVFEGYAAFFRGGAMYDEEKKTFRAPSLRKVPGVLLRPDLLDLDRDGDLDLVLATVEPSGMGGASGSAPGIAYLFPFEKGAFSKRPTWQFRGPVPMTAFGAIPQPAATFLPDLDGNGLPEVIERREKVYLHEALEEGGFDFLAEAALEGAGAPAVGNQIAVVPGKSGLVFVEVER